METTPPTVRYNVQLLAEDMAARGLTKLDLARRAGVSDMTVIRFLRGSSQTAPTVLKLARAMGYSPRRYVIRSSSEGAAA